MKDINEQSTAELCLLLSAVVTELQRRAEQKKPLRMWDIRMTPRIGKKTAAEIAKTLRERGIEVIDD